MFKYILIILLFSIASIAYAQETQTKESKPVSEWKYRWEQLLGKLDSMFVREQAQFRLMQSYQNDADEKLILQDIDSLRVLKDDVNAHIDICNKFACPNTDEGRNASETLNLKVGALKEYFDQCMMQIQVNNGILQKKLKNETLDFKVSQITELFTGFYKPLFTDKIEK